MDGKTLSSINITSSTDFDCLLTIHMSEGGLGLTPMQKGLGLTPMQKVRLKREIETATQR